MKASALKYGILSLTASLVTVVILLVPFHALLTVWAASNFGHYTAFRLWEEMLLAVAALGALYLLLFDRKTRLATLYHELTWVILVYIALQLSRGLWAYYHHQVTEKAVADGLVLDLRFPVFFLAAWVASSRTKRLPSGWSRLLVWPALIVIAIGLLQAFVLPSDFLKHFGYGPGTIMPTETINHNSHYPRIMSTLRGANPLGAYLLIPISGLLVLMSVGKRNWRRGLMLLAAVVVLFFSFSRSAWIGAFLAALAVAAFRFGPRYKRYVLPGVCAILAAGAVLAVGLRHNVTFQNLIFHTQQNSAVASTSNEGHAAALKQGVHDLMAEPFGSGAGSAGPASIYNNGRPRLAEDYFLQIGQETGWLGLVLFLAINGFMGFLLWQRRADPLSLALLASLVGITFVNLLSHAWTDETLAYVWWGLAGIAIGGNAKRPEEQSRGKQQA